MERILGQVVVWQHLQQRTFLDSSRHYFIEYCWIGKKRKTKLTADSDVGIGLEIVDVVVMVISEL
jgi:hypothetical protein